jgi:hypothetical protein
MNRASQALAQGVPPGGPKSYRALEDHVHVPRSTLHYRARGRRSIEERAQSCTDRHFPESTWHSGYKDSNLLAILASFLMSRPAHFSVTGSSRHHRRCLE